MVGFALDYCVNKDVWKFVTLTALSIPSVSNMMKKTMAQNVEPGSVEMASG